VGDFVFCFDLFLDVAVAGGFGGVAGVFGIGGGVGGDYLVPEGVGEAAVLEVPQRQFVGVEETVGGFVVDVIAEQPADDLRDGVLDGESVFEVGHVFGTRGRNGGGAEVVEAVVASAHRGGTATDPVGTDVMAFGNVLRYGHWGYIPF
jgi:hypothetical protein